MTSPPPSDALDVLELMRAAAIARSAGDMSSVYALDAVHEFPFTRPGVPARAEGRDAIMNFITAFWSTSPLRYERYRTIAIHGTADRRPDHPRTARRHPGRGRPLDRRLRPAVGRRAHHRRPAASGGRIVEPVGLIDEYRARVYPVLVGGGIPFFAQRGRRVDLELVETRTFSSRVVYLRYRVAR
jgi:hypothetical protein